MTEENEPSTTIETINEFYKLKDKYETTYYEKYIKPIILSKKSSKEKRVDFSKLPKNPCINCKRNVGTIFSVTNNNLKRSYIAKCGDISQPCPLNIQINYGERELYDKIIKRYMDDIDNLKLQIIIQKNNIIFFGKNDGTINIESFDKLTQELKSDSTMAGYLIEQNILKNDNPSKNELLKKLVDEFGKGYLLPFKQMVNEYSVTNNEIIMNQAVSFYVNEMIPKLNEIQALKYEVNFMEYNNDNKNYYLVQQKNSLQNQEYADDDDDKVISFTRGTKQVSSSKTEKNKTNTNTNTVKTKTRKLKPTIELVDEADFDEKQPIEYEEFRFE